MMSGWDRAWHPSSRPYGRSNPGYGYGYPGYAGRGVRPGSSGMGSPSPYGGGYGQSYPGVGFRPPMTPMGARPAAASQAAGRPGAVSARTAKDVKNVNNDQETAQTQASATEKNEAAATVPAEPEAVEAEVVETAPESASKLDDELEKAAGEAVAAAIEESELVAKAQAEAADWKDKYMRLHAEWDTYRRRMKEQGEVQKALANEKIVSSLLPVLDDFERTITYAKDNGETGLLGGVEAVYSKLIDTLQKDGVEVLDPQGQAFDALEAQAVATVPDESVPDETVHQVYQKGYKMGSKVLRPAMVTVTTGGPKREKPAEDDASESA